MLATVFLAAYFVGNGEDGLHFAFSRDGLTFEAIGGSVLRPAVGPDKLMRDPCLAQGPDGVWHMVWTTGWWDQGIGVASSKDLVHWSEQRFVPVMSAYAGTINAWAPEIAYDPAKKEWIVFWSSTVPGRFSETSRTDGDLGKDGVPLNHRYYYTTTADFQTFAPTKLLWNPGFNCIDLTMLRIGREWLLVGKDETKAPKPAKHLFAATATSPTGPYKMVAPRMTGDYWAEGPTAVRLGKTTRVFFDRYMDGRWGAVESTDLVHWADVGDRVSFPAGARHGAVLQVPREVVDRLKESADSVSSSSAR